MRGLLTCPHACVLEKVVYSEQSSNGHNVRSSHPLPLATADVNLSTRLTSLNFLYTINALLPSTTLPSLSIGQTIW